MTVAAHLDREEHATDWGAKRGRDARSARRGEYLTAEVVILRETAEGAEAAELLRHAGGHVDVRPLLADGKSAR